MKKFLNILSEAFDWLAMLFFTGIIIYGLGVWFIFMVNYNHEHKNHYFNICIVIYCDIL